MTVAGRVESFNEIKNYILTMFENIYLEFMTAGLNMRG